MLINGEYTNVTQRFMRNIETKSERINVIFTSLFACVRAKAITSTNRVTTRNCIRDGEVHSPSKPVYLLRVSEIIFFLLQKASTRSPFFRPPGDKREEEARGEDIVSRRRQYPPAGLRHSRQG